MSSPLPWGTPSMMSNRTTSPSSFRPMRWASVPPICPAPMSAILLRAIGERILGRGAACLAVSLDRESPALQAERARSRLPRTRSRRARSGPVLPHRLGIASKGVLEALEGAVFRVLIPHLVRRGISTPEEILEGLGEGMLGRRQGRGGRRGAPDLVKIAPDQG